MTENMTWDEIETRTAEIEEILMNDSSADVDALEKEVTELEQRKAELAKEIETRKAEIDEVINTAAEIHEFEERKETKNMEIRNSKEYIDAYAEYMKTGKDAEVRSLLTENADNGTVAVPDFVYDIVKTAWEEENILSRVRKVSVPGTLKVNFEISGTDAVIHEEGSGEVTEEQLQLGIVTLTPHNAKKWISISDEVYDLRGEEFLRYIYDEITHKIYKVIADDLVASISTLPETANAQMPAAPRLAVAPAIGTVASAMALLSDEATNPVIIMNKATWGAFKAAQYAANFPVDPFEGLPVLFSNQLKSYDNASAGDTYMIVGDLGNGALANFPKGDDVVLKFDDLSLATSDMIKIIGRVFVAAGPIANNAFVNVRKA